MLCNRTKSRKFQVLVKNRTFDQKSNFWSKIGLLVKNRTFGQTLDFWSKIGLLVKNQTFGQKSNFWSRIELLVKIRRLRQKSNFWSKIKISTKNRNFGQKCQSEIPKLKIFLPKMEIFQKNENSDFLLLFCTLDKKKSTQKVSGRNFDFQ